MGFLKALFGGSQTPEEKQEKENKKKKTRRISIS